MTTSAAAGSAAFPETTRNDPGSETVSFHFRCLGYDFRAWTHRENGRPGLSVACDVGSLPYTAENREARRNALLVLSRAGHIAGTRLILTGFQKISVLSSLPLGEDREVTDVIGGAAAAVINALPLIALMSDCLTTPVEAV